MSEFLVIAALLGACDALIAVGAWKLLSRSADRPPFVRVVGALLGAFAGAWVAEPQLDFVVRHLGYRQEAGQMANLFTYPFSVPVTTGIAGWLFAETIGGRSSRPFVAAAMSCAGSFLGAALVFLPFFFVRGAWRVISAPVILAVPVAGSVLALAFSRWTRAHGPPKRPLQSDGRVGRYAPSRARR